MEDSSIFGQLVPTGGGDSIPLLKRKLVMGRRGCDVELRFPNVSSRHCELELINGYWFVRDLQSANGIKVNGTRCHEKWLLPGDMLTVARHQYEIVYEALGERPVIEEEDPLRYGLLEKAGLARSESPRREAAVPRAPRPANPEDDAAMRWLMGDD